LEEKRKFSSNIEGYIGMDNKDPDVLKLGERFGRWVGFPVNAPGLYPYFEG
jgi:hypothetical protein